ncbi:hypothetical protein A8W25_05110 [Streptomyces sp. ERV7]|nr:hypothetical protein A8W25_05110 [Streptomyces sp. ERV7]
MPHGPAVQSGETAGGRGGRTGVYRLVLEDHDVPAADRVRHLADPGRWTLLGRWPVRRVHELRGQYGNGGQQGGHGAESGTCVHVSS